MITCFLIVFSFDGWSSERWLEEVQKRIDKDGVAWLRDKIRAEMNELSNLDVSNFGQTQCDFCFTGGIFEMDPKIYICMSFSIPEETWLKLSLELEQYHGIFVLKGLPRNNFQEFARKLANLKRKGMSSAVQIDPKLFKRFHVEQAPTFILFDGQSFDKISGNISLTYALERVAYKAAEDKLQLAEQ